MITFDRAREILEKYNKDAFHLHHADTVSGVMRHFAREYDPGNEEKWAIVGLLHDVDFELYPEEHCVKGEEILKGEGVDEDIMRSCMSHGWGLSGTTYKPEHIMEKVLFATDELTGLIGAVVLMRPSKSTLDLETPSVKKKFKDKKFAAGCSRDVIINGAADLGWELDDLIGRTIIAMREVETGAKS
ncbi:MAG: hydrolase [Lachnospiraceae bacterium]|jgi:predicted hydrolase (HD superfamily)|nr:hydrolase [Lachnospiraceae bacterium]